MFLKNIYKSFDGAEVLRDFTMEIADGEHVALMGKSGKGKTTILNIIMGFEAPDCGETDITKEIATVFQEDRLSESFSAISNVCLMNGNKEIANKLGIESEKYVNTMSGGQKRRVALARCLSRTAKLYIFDEALKGLDEKTKAVAMTVIKEYTCGRSVLFVTHDINEARDFADRIVEI